MEDKRKLIAAARFMHDGVYLHTGDIFESSEEDAADLISIGMAIKPSMAETVQAAAERIIKRTYQRRDMKAEN